MKTRKISPRRQPNLLDYLWLENDIRLLREKVDDLTNVNRQLTADLDTARSTIVDLMDARGLLDGYIGLEEHTDLLVWREKAVERVLAVADVRDGNEMGNGMYGDRALCPLCRRSANGSGRVRGFAFPEGLRRHLLGDYNCAQCEVFGAADKSIIRRIRAKNVHARETAIAEALANARSESRVRPSRGARRSRP
jgi:hypothetical protein